MINQRAIGRACERKVYSCSDSDVVVKIRYNNNSKTRMRVRACVCAALRRRHVTPRTSRRARSGPRRQCVTWIAARLPLERGVVVVDFFGGRGGGKGPARATNMTRAPARTVHLPAGNIILLVYRRHVFTPKPLHVPDRSPPLGTR